MKLREAEASAPENGSRSVEANTKQNEARRAKQTGGNLAKEWDLSNNTNGYTRAGWVWRMLDQMLFKPFCWCLPIFNRSDPQCLSAKTTASVPGEDATQDPVLPKSSGMSKLISSFRMRSVQRGPPIKRGPQPHPH